MEKKLVYYDGELRHFLTLWREKCPGSEWVLREGILSPLVMASLGWSGNRCGMDPMFSQDSAYVQSRQCAQDDYRNLF